MKSHTNKLLCAGGIALILSSPISGRIFTSVEAAHTPGLAAFAAVYSGSNSHALADPRPISVAMPARPAAIESTRPGAIKLDFSPYVRLHVSRLEIRTREGID